MGKYSIKELEQLSGIKAHTLRIWEKRYKLFEPNRTPTNIRFYTDQDLRKLLSVTLLCNVGVKISKIVSMGEAEINQRILEIEDKVVENQKRVDDLIFPMIEYDEDAFNSLFHQYVDEIGLEKTFTSVIYPFLEKVGILWLSDEVNAAQEHFVTNIIRHKLSIAVEELPKVAVDAKKIILFLPEGEFHELGLLFFSFLYKKKGQRVYYLGQSVPIQQLVESAEVIQPDMILFYSIIHPKIKIEKILQRISVLKTKAIFFLENKYQNSFEINYPANITRVVDYKEII